MGGHGAATGVTIPGPSCARATSAAAIFSRRRVPADRVDPGAFRVADAISLRPTRDAGSLREDGGGPRAISRKMSPGDFVRELGLDNKTTIPAPWTRGYGPPPAGVEGARTGAQPRTDPDSEDRHSRGWTTNRGTGIAAAPPSGAASGSSRGSEDGGASGRASRPVPRFLPRRGTTPLPASGARSHGRRSAAAEQRRRAPAAIGRAVAHEGSGGSQPAQQRRRDLRRLLPARAAAAAESSGGSPPAQRRRRGRR